MTAWLGHARLRQKRLRDTGHGRGFIERFVQPVPERSNLAAQIHSLAGTFDIVQRHGEARLARRKKGTLCCQNTIAQAEKGLPQLTPRLLAD